MFRDLIMMSSDESSVISLEEVDEALTEIENKYSPVKSSKKRDGFEETLGVLSKEFDSVGLPTIDTTQSLIKVFKQVVSAARSLIHIHRKTLSQMKDVNVDNRCKTTKSAELYRIIDDFKIKISKYEDKNNLLQNKIIKLSNENEKLIKQEMLQKNEFEKVKRYHSSKQNELHHHIKKLTRENQHLKEILDKDINISHSRDDVTIKLLNKYRTNEEIYKNTIQKLQGNNKELLEEIFNLKEEQLMNICTEANHP